MRRQAQQQLLLCLQPYFHEGEIHHLPGCVAGVLSAQHLGIAGRRQPLLSITDLSSSRGSSSSSSISCSPFVATSAAWEAALRGEADW
jgi:hypothetical protein